MDRYPEPGRGAWRLTGGLLPAKPGSTSKAGYYRAPAAGEKAPGQIHAQGGGGHDEECVYYGVIAIQKLVGATPDGWFGPLTAAKVVAAQRRYKIEDDGIVGRASMRAFLTPLINDYCSHNGVAVTICGGLLVNESALDPAAVGVNGQDHGVAQINLGAHPTVRLDQALDPDYAILFTVEDLAEVAQSWLGRTTANPWDIAIASHNSPALARRWAIDGEPPYVEGRIFQIEEYVQKVRAAW